MANKQSLLSLQQLCRRFPCLNAGSFTDYLRHAAKIYVATSHSVVQLETIETCEHRTAFV